METEARAILAASERLDKVLLEAVDLILGHPGKVIVTGLGKSGHVGRKIAATFQSTGTPSVFLHAAEAAHGDLGVCQTGDPVVMISKSGTTAEMLDLVARPARTAVSADRNPGERVLASGCRDGRGFGCLRTTGGRS